MNSIAAVRTKLLCAKSPSANAETDAAFQPSGEGLFVV